ncbi:hypothetical protein SLE2022_003150 [Rubroshorea leprosula]
MGTYDYLWTHALNSADTHNGILKYCDFVNWTYSEQGNNYEHNSDMEVGKIDFYNIYAPLCLDPAKNIGKPGSIDNFDPCTDNNLYNYLNTPETLISSGMRVWFYSCDSDSIVPVTSSRYSINTYNLPIKTPWRAWSTNNEVGGYVEEYEGLTFVTVRGSGHMVPSYQPERSLTMFSSFLQGPLQPLQ